MYVSICSSAHPSGQIYTSIRPRRSTRVSATAAPRSHRREKRPGLFASWRHELHELFDCGESVVAAVSFHARSRTSGVAVVQEEGHTWTLRDGRVVRFEWGRDPPTALDAAGLRR